MYRRVTNHQLFQSYPTTRYAHQKIFFKKNAKIKKTFIVLFYHQECGESHIPTE